ncbi:type 1 glutamine amidotransferase [Thalassococcus sp. BH17M4-6]|uniref:type 1 glutamine amidotransferase n=1 Tax=Thalassococcus sp. BH17M4-6 TaxID=3413148 RepID=UPI003BE4E5BA
MKIEGNQETYTLVLNQPDYLDPGYVGHALTNGRNAWRLESRSVFDWNLDERVNGVILLGSVENPLDPSSNLRVKELRFIEELLKREVPLFAVCYGAQLLAQCLSAKVFELSETGFGFRTVEFGDNRLPSGPQFFWHHYAFECPVEASVLAARGSACDAFVYDKSLAVQFHPDATPEILDTWMTAGSSEVISLKANTDDQLRTARENKRYSEDFMNAALRMVKSL